MQAEDVTIAHINAHQTVFAALVMTHPRPMEFADTLQKLTEQNRALAQSEGAGNSAEVIAERILCSTLKAVARLAAGLDGNGHHDQAASSDTFM